MMTKEWVSNEYYYFQFSMARSSAARNKCAFSFVSASWHFRALMMSSCCHVNQSPSNFWYITCRMHHALDSQCWHAVLHVLYSCVFLVYRLAAQDVT